MKKKIAVFAILLALFSIVAMGTLAYYTDAEIAHNIITTGEVDIRVVETMMDGTTEIPYPDTSIEIMPGRTVSKIVRVENLDAPAYVRAKYELSCSGPEIKEGMVQIAIGPDWQYNSDGWYYYNGVVTDQTTEFFKEVIFDGASMTNEYQNCTLTILVKAQAVQADNNGASALEAIDWPVEDQEKEEAVNE